MLIMDEFYSHFYYEGCEAGLGFKPGDDENQFPSVSSASYINDVDSDPVVIINGFTKSWRCPGIRVCWVVAPKPMIVNMSASGSFMDGGACHAFQEWALPLMDPKFIKEDALALQVHFRTKRDYMLTELAKLGITTKWKPTATFYIFACIGALPSPLNNCAHFCSSALQHKVIVVPGTAFDINPRKRRRCRDRMFKDYIRISYGPPMVTLQNGIEGFRKMIWEAKTGGTGLER